MAQGILVRARYHGPPLVFVHFLQTSLAEAYQRKWLYTISRSHDFEVVDEQESAVGPRHFPVRDPRLLPPPTALRRGDRVILLPSTSALAELPCSQTPIPSFPPEGSGGQPPTQLGTDGNQETMGKSSGASAGLQDSRNEIISGSDHANSSCTQPPSTTLEARNNGLGTTLNEVLMGRKDEISAEQLIQISEAYREAGNTLLEQVAAEGSLMQQFQNLADVVPTVFVLARKHLKHPLDVGHARRHFVRLPH